MTVRRRWTLPFLIAVVCSTIGGPIPASDGGLLTLDDAQRLALENNPELQAMASNVQAIEGRAMQGRTAPNPELDIRFWHLEGEPTDPDRGRVRAILSQTLELGGKQRRRFDLARAESDVARRDRDARRAQIMARTAGRFAAVLGGQRRAASARELVEFLEAMQEKVSSLTASGSLPRVEQHRATRQLGLARIDLQQAEAALSAARFRLASTWSGSPDFSEASGDLERLRPLPDLEVVLQLARSGPAATRWDAELARGDAAVRLAKAGRVPDLEYGFGGRWTEGIDDPDYIVDLEIPIPILDRNRGEVIEARHDLERIKAERRAADSVREEWIAELYYGLVASKARSETIAREILPAATATAAALRTGFEMMEETPASLFNARRDQTRAEADYIDALVEYHETLAALEGAVGRGLR